ncbi:conjugal transfer protein TraG N-terminal domain-containing protein, partial [Avibacterium sp. 20-15]
TLIFVQFALVTVSFWWELARWLDSFLISILYNSPGHQSEISWAFLQNSRDDVIMSFVLGMMFLVLPGVWVAAMSWAGVGLGNLASHFANSSKQVQASGSEGTKLLKPKTK